MVGLLDVGVPRDFDALLDLGAMRLWRGTRDPRRCGIVETPFLVGYLLRCKFCSILGFSSRNAILENVSRDGESCY